MRRNPNLSARFSRGDRHWFSARDTKKFFIAAVLEVSGNLPRRGNFKQKSDSERNEFLNWGDALPDVLRSKSLAMGEVGATTHLYAY